MPNDKSVRSTITLHPHQKTTQMELTVFTRSKNEVLYERMRSLIPATQQCERLTGYDEWQDAASFLHQAIEQENGIALCLDEDCFVIDWPKIVALCQYVHDNGISFCGVPDGGGAVHHRTFSPITANPSFVIFNAALLKPAKEQISRQQIDWHGYAPWMEKYINAGYGEINHGSQEVFNGLSYWAVGIAPPLYLQARTMGDGIANEILSPHGVPLALHTWYSRTYGLDEANTKRIDFHYEQALKYKQ